MERIVVTVGGGWSAGADRGVLRSKIERRVTEIVPSTPVHVQFTGDFGLALTVHVEGGARLPHVERMLHDRVKELLLAQPTK